MKHPLDRAAELPPAQQIVNAHVAEAEWKDPDDLGTRARNNGARTVRGYRKVWVIQTLHESREADITAAHVKAALKLLGLYELGVLGATRGGVTDRVDSNGGTDIAVERLAALTGYREAMQALGVEAGAIVAVVALENWPITRLAEATGLNWHTAFGRLQAGLERLREHFWPPQPVGIIRPAAAPALVWDADVADVPQERLGRWRASVGREISLRKKTA